MRRWILLRGLTRDRRHWDGFPAQLRAAMPGWDTLELDLPGNGQRCSEQSPATVAAMLADCRGEVARRGIEPPYHVLAVSLGAMVATDWMATRPDELAAAVLVNTSLRPHCPWHWRLRPGALPLLLRALSAAGAPLEREAAIYALTSRHPELAASVVPRWARWYAEAPVSAANALRQLRAAARFRAPLAAPPVPVLLLAAAGDRLVDPRCTRRIAAAWGVPFREHPAAGHDLPLDDGPWVAGRIAEWAAAGFIAT